MNFKFSVYIVLICYIAINESKLEKESKNPVVGLETEETKIKITKEVKESKTGLPSSNASIKNLNIINTKDDNSTEDLQKKKPQNATDRQEKEQKKPIPYKKKMSDDSIDAKGPKQSPIKSSSEEGFNTRSENILIISLGGGEDEILMSQMAWLFYRHQKRVTLLLYGEHHREENLPEFVKIITIPIGDDDPIRSQDNNYVGLTPEDSSRGEWVSGQILWSRVAACKGLMNKESEIIKLNPDVIISPLFLHDVCVLSLSFRLKIPVVGVLTSRVGAWWTWAQLGVLPSLSTASVPLTSLGNRGLFSRASNLASHYNYMSSLRQQWQVKAVNALAPMDVPSLTELYGTVSRLVLSWDPLVDPSVIPVPTAVPIGGFASILSDEDDQEILKEMLANRAGVILVFPGTLEAWVGEELLNYLWKTLSKTGFTIFWKAKHSHLLPNITKESNEDLRSFKAKFIYKSKLPVNFVLNHPRHRLLISTCGESDVMAAIYFGSPILCLPVTTDQYLAAKELQRLGVAEFVLPGSTANEELTEYIHKITTHRNYRLRARELAEEMHDQPLTPSERLLFHVENVVRRPNC